MNILHGGSDKHLTWCGRCTCSEPTLQFSPEDGVTCLKCLEDRARLKAEIEMAKAARGANMAHEPAYRKKALQ